MALMEVQRSHQKQQRVNVLGGGAGGGTGGKMTRPVFTVYTSSVSKCSVRMFIHSGFTTTVGVYLIRVNDPLGTARHTGGYVTALTAAAGSGL